MKTFKIGSITLKNRFVMAPLAGYTNHALRQIAALGGAALTYTEMISANALIYDNKKTASMLPSGPEQVPVALQLFGGDPEVIFEAEKILNKQAYFDLLDFNMGCPVPKVMKQRAGSYWLKRQAEIYELLRGMVKLTSKPVVIKTRLGYSSGEKNVLEIVKLAFDAGVQAVAIHGRTRDQFYSGAADHTLIKEAIDLDRGPIIANGDIDAANFLQIDQMLHSPAYMLGRGALGNPFVFRQLAELEEGKEITPITAEEIIFIMGKHFDLLAEIKGENGAAKDFRTLSALYLKGQPFAHRFKSRLIAINSRADLTQILADFRSVSAGFDWL